jgi:enoyl-CoA hydratase/carnithine racemase
MVAPAPDTGIKGDKVMTDEKHIQVETVGAVGRITFDRPERLNSLRPETMDALMQAVAGFEAEPDVRAILITGRGEAFSSGGDMDFLDELTEMAPFAIKETVYRYFQGAVKRVKLCPKPTVAAVHGPAVGAGCEMAIACDFRIATPEAVFYESWRDLGIIPPLGGMFLLPRLVGLGKATEMVLLGERVGGEEAARIGLVNKVVPRAELEAEAMTLAGRLAEGPPLAYAAAKEGLRRGMESSLNAEWEFNIHAQSLLFQSEDYAEAAQAFRDKRKPVFKGR